VTPGSPPYAGPVPFVDATELPVRAPRPGWNGRFFHSEQMTFGYYEIEAGATLHEHSHDNEEVWHVLAGELEMRVDGDRRVLGPGCAAVVLAGHLHSARAVTDCRAIVVDQPRREQIGGVPT
jgi:quercetin dioxygenase-like cupin family protein